MAEIDPLLKTQQVAEALGVSVSTIKRWVDAGALKARRTVGKHRLISLSDALAFASRQGLPTDRLQALAGSVVVESLGLDDRTVDALVRALVGGETRRARSIIHSAYAACRDASMLADRLIRPAMERIGHEWAVGTVDVFQEHQASQAIVAALTEIVERLSRSQAGGGPLALGATPEGDLYTLSLLLGELTLLEAGWDVRNLGSNLPLRSLGQAAAEYRPRLIFLSVGHVADEARFVREYREFYRSAAAVDAAVIVGGRALGADLRARLNYASYGERLTHLAEFARRIALPAAGRTSLAHSHDGTADPRHG